MRHSQRRLKPVALLGALSLASVVVLSGAVATAATALAGVEVIDFEDGTTGTWVPNDAVTLAVIPDMNDATNTVLDVSDRTATHFGIQSPTGVFDASVEYTFSADVFLGTASDVRFIAFDEGADNTYNWVGSSSVAAQTWTTVTGTFTFAAGSIDTAKAYIEVDSTDDYLVDNLEVSALGAPNECVPGTVTVASYDFESAVEPWTPRGAQEVEVSADARNSGGALMVTGRTEAWHGAQLDVSGTLTAGTYEISAFAKLPNSAVGDVEVNLGMNQPGADNEYPWVGDRVTVDGAEWVEIGGTYTVDSDTPPALLYLESTSASELLLLDDVVITQEASCDTAPEPGTVAFSTGFEDGLDGWELRDPGVAGEPEVAVTTEQAHGGAQSAEVSGRTSQGHGLRFDVTDELVEGATYELSAWVRFADGQASDDVWLSLENTRSDATTYSTLKQFTGMSNTEWVQITAKFTMPATDSAYIWLFAVECGVRSAR